MSAFCSGVHFRRFMAGLLWGISHENSPSATTHKTGGKIRLSHQVFGGRMALPLIGRHVSQAT